VPLQVEVQVLDLSLSGRRAVSWWLRVCDACGDDSILDLRFLSFYGSQQRALEAAREAG
jgi:hypothetical protein